MPAPNSPKPATTTRTTLNELKSMLLRYSERIHETTQNGAAIISALQSLLKCAEMRYKCCFVEDCSHASYAQTNANEAVSTSGVGGSSAVQSGTTSMKVGGDNQCCSGSMQANSFDGGGGGGGEGSAVEAAAATAYEAVSRGSANGSIGGNGFGSYSSDVEQTDADLEDDLFVGNHEFAVGGAREWGSSDDSFLTADEGYDGDAEQAASLCSDEADFDDDASHTLRSSQIPSSRYRNRIVHADICRIVIDILIELAKRCVDEPDFWPKYLLPIAARLTAIRDSIGGSLFLINGFASVLRRSDVRLRDFQKAILELIADVNTPETLTAYLGILAAGTEPPVDLLLPRLIYLSSSSHSVQPKTQMVFPSVDDGCVSAGAEPRSFTSVQEFREFHVYHRLRSAFTRATYFVPLHHLSFNPWSPKGFTVAMWINVQPSGRPSGAASQSSGFGGSSERSDPSSSAYSTHHAARPRPSACSAHCAWDDKTHLVSLGSNRLMLSVYLHSVDPSTMFFQLTKPNAPITDHKTTTARSSRHAEGAPADDSTVTGKPSASTSTTCGCRRSSPLRKENTDLIGLNVLASTANAFKTTRIALRNSLSQFNLFAGAGVSGADAAEYHSQRYPLEVKGVRLIRNKWTHLALSVIVTSKEMTIRITIDGLDHLDVHLPCFAAPKYEKFQVLCLGETQSTAVGPSESVDIAAEPLALSYSLSTVQLFQNHFADPQPLATLVALGPDCPSLVECQIAGNAPNYGLLNAQRCNALIATAAQSALDIKFLREHLVASMSASDMAAPVMGYSRADPSSAAGLAMRLNVLTSGPGAPSKPIQTIQSAIALSGGLSVLLFLFARVVELGANEHIQAATLSHVLRSAHTNSELYAEFRRRDGLSLLGPVIMSARCHKSVQLLNALLDVACDQPVLTMRSDHRYHVNPLTQACLIHADLLVSVIRRYADWHTTGQPNGVIIETLLAALQALVREKHPWQAANIRRLNEAALIPALFHFCKLYLVGIPNPVPITVSAAKSLVGLVSTFAGAPPPSTLLDDVVKVLLLLHRPSDSFITHDRSKFYFLVTSMVLAKPKQRLSLPHLPSGRRLSLNIRRKNATNVTNSTTPFPNIQRSVSLNQTAISVLDTDPSLDELPIVVPHTDELAVSGADTNETMIELSQIADCSRLRMSRSLKTLRDVVIDSKRRFRHRSGTSSSAAASKKRIVKRSARQRIRSGRMGSGTADTDSEPNVGEKEKNGFAGDVSGLVKQYEIITTEDIRRLSDTIPKRPADLASQYSDVSSTMTSDGVQAIQSGFFDLLKDFILILPDAIIVDVLAHYVTVEVVLVMANHRDPVVRTSIIRLLSHMSHRLSEGRAAHCQKQRYWLHLGNQVALHTVSGSLVQACCQWIIGGSCLSVEQMIAQPDLRIADKIGLHALLAVLGQTTGDLLVIRPLLLFLDRLYGSVATTDERAYMVDNGLLAALSKALTRFLHQWGTTQQDTVVACFHRLASTIASIALRGSGSINVLWDLLNILTFVGDTRNVCILRGIRACKAVVLATLLQSFLPTTNTGSTAGAKFNVSDISLACCTLSTAEIRTRFDLLIDRVVQFITTAEPSYQPTEPEFRLIECMLQLTVTGFSRSSNVITWSLCPSRPVQLKLYTVHMLYRQITSGTIPLQLCCDLKVLKIMIAAMLATDSLIIAGDDQEALHQLAQALFIQTPVTLVPNLSQTLEKIESHRLDGLRDQRPAVERSIFKLEPIVQSCIESAMKLTRGVVELQNTERRQLMNEMRADDESQLTKEWRQLIARMTHEGAPWHSAKHYPRSWRLDDTEGPARSRTRLTRCHLDVDERFLMTPAPDGSVAAADRSPPPLSFLQDSLVKRPHFPLNDQVLYTFACAYLPVDVVVDGEMIVTETQLIFLANDVHKEPIRLSMADITEIWLRRHQHRDTGLEFWLASQQSVLFVFGDGGDRAVLVQFFADKVVHFPDEQKLASITQHWAEGHLTNWEYLMTLNQISGRTYQDLMQYPIFPWVLADYESATLDLNDGTAFRKFERPIAVQHKESEMHYINNYNYLKQAQAELISTGNVKASSHMTPYHYGSHYSNSGTVLHFMVRVPPFTKFFLRYQDNSFDLPDRTFHAMRTTWRLASRDSPTDVKELIPEFFTLPEMLENFEQFRFGNRQSGERVDHVSLPAWAADSSRLFVLIHRQALESNVVRTQLHRWIDLVFGWRQTGEAAVDAINVFHPATYIGFSAADCSDSVEKKAFETMVRTYGQMPRQLFDSPHPAAIVPVQHIVDPATRISAHVKGLRWGAFTGSPQLPDPIIGQTYPGVRHTHRFQSICALRRTNVCYALPSGCNVMQGSEPDTMNVVLWTEPDGIVRIRSFNEDRVIPNHRSASSSSSSSSAQHLQQPLLAVEPDDPITCCGSDPASDQLWFGHRSGRVVVHQWSSAGGTGGAQQQKYNKSRFVQHSSSFNFSSYNSAFRKTPKESPLANGSGSGGSGSQTSLLSSATSRWKEPVVLIRHTDEVTAIAISDEFKVAVSVSLDGLAALWDTNTLEYVRCIARPSICPSAPIALVAISSTLGDIVTVHSVEGRAAGNIPITADDCLEATELEEQDHPLDEHSDLEDLDDFVTVPLNLGGSKSVMRLHTVNAKYVCHLVDADAIKCVAYSSIKEGTGVNVVATGYAAGVVRMWSSWDLTLVREIRPVIGSSTPTPGDVISVAFSTYQHLSVLDADNVIRVWQSDGLGGRPPKYPQSGLPPHRKSDSNNAYLYVLFL